MSLLNITTYVVVNTLLFSAWYILLFSKKRRNLLFVDRLIGAFILGLTQIVVTEMLLGILFKGLYAMPLFILNILISSIVLSWVVISSCKSSPFPELFKNILSEFKDEAARFFNVIKRDALLLCIFVLFFISVCYMVFLGYLFPSYTWDALWYHLPIVGYIMQSGAIKDNFAPSFIDLFINIFPKNLELFFLWNTIFLESDIIIDLSQLFFTLVGVLAIYSIAIKLKVREGYAVYSSLLFFFTPIVILQSTTNYVDIAISVLFLIAINFLMYDVPEDSRFEKTPIFLSGLTAGILLGSKVSGPLFFLTFSSAIAIHKIIGYFRNNGHSIKDSIMPYTKYFIVPAILMGGYWYIKNWLLYQNPVYPMEISIFDITLFKGLYGGIVDPAPQIINKLSSLARPFYVWLERVEYYLYDSRLSGFGPIWFILFLPSSVFSFIYAVKRKKYNFLFLGIILIIVFLFHPRNWNTRYVIFIVGLGAISFGLVLECFDKKGRVLKVIALLLVIYTFLTANSPCIMPKKIKEFISLPVKERTIARHAQFNIDLYARPEYGYWIWIRNNVLKGDTLAYTFEPLFLSPLWNNGFSSKVVYIKSDSYNKWMEDMKKNNVSYILVRQSSMEDKWINEARKLLGRFWWFGAIEERFKVVYSDENYKIVKGLK
ncbi:MAG: hypothetical protein HY752_04760 [Nitrospirae bacterium]|nr:hypothetical protein [Nitrospirota bacterium]